MWLHAPRRERLARRLWLAAYRDACSPVLKSLLVRWYKYQFCIQLKLSSEPMNRPFSLPEITVHLGSDSNISSPSFAGGHSEQRATRSQLFRQSMQPHGHSAPWSVPYWAIFTMTYTKMLALNVLPVSKLALEEAMQYVAEVSVRCTVNLENGMPNSFLSLVTVAYIGSPARPKYQYTQSTPAVSKSHFLALRQRTVLPG